MTKPAMPPQPLARRTWYRARDWSATLGASPADSSLPFFFLPFSSPLASPVGLLADPALL